MELRAVEQFAHLLARAVRQFRTYPSASPVCREAVEGCHRALVSIEDRDQIAVRVTPRELMVDEVALGAGTIVEHELARRLHRAHVAGVAIDRAASPRDLSRFCGDLVAVGRENGNDQALTLADRLVEHGVDRVTLRMAHRLAVLDVGAPPAERHVLVEGERRRRERGGVATGPTYHLYPPDRGWVRVDPVSRFDQISLVDLAILVDDPAVLATMLMRLTDDEPGDADDRGAALERRFADVARLLGSLEPRLARVMFAKLARAVLNLDPERRNVLLQRTILPDLIDGRSDGAVLREFPDLELADSLCLLLDLEASAPEVLATALNRLDLTPERRATVVPLLESRLRAPEGAGSSAEGEAGENGVERHARRLIRIDQTEARSFADFAVFDLALDGEADSVLARLRDDIRTTGPLAARLGCLWSLVRLEPNPELAARFLDRSMVLLGTLEREGRWPDVSSWMLRHRQLADTLREPRPDVAEAIAARLSVFCSPDRLVRVAALHASGPEGRTAAAAMVEALGPDLVPALVSALSSRASGTLVPFMCDHASRLAPGLSECAGHPDAVVNRAVMMVLARAGAGYETAVAGQLRSADDQMVREALQALVQIGTPRAAALVAGTIATGDATARQIAEQALLCFPASEIERQTRAFLGRRDLVMRHPETAGRLLDRAVETNAAGLDGVVRPLAALRFRFWNPALVRVARKARALQVRS